MTAFIENKANLLFADLIQTFPHPDIRIRKQNITTILVRIGSIITLKLMLYKGEWRMVANDLVFRYTGHLWQRLFLSKANRQLRDQVVSHLTSKFAVKPIHQFIA